MSIPFDISISAFILNSSSLYVNGFMLHSRCLPETNKVPM